MSLKDKAKNPTGKVPREEVVRAVTEKVKEGRITCAAAHSLAKSLNVPPEEVGLAADVLGVKIAKCQLGLFGYGPDRKKVGPAPEIASRLREAIESSLVNGRLGCAASWGIAEEFQISRMEVASACEAMKVKIRACQLGAF
jgi:hypothetical protein